MCCVLWLCAILIYASCFLQSILNNGNSNRSVISISMFYSSIFDYVLYSSYVLFSLLITLSYSCSCSFFLHQQLLSYWHYGLWALLRGSTLQQALLLLHHTTRHARVETVDRFRKIVWSSHHIIRGQGIKDHLLQYYKLINISNTSA
jgi:hypothetical protein